MLKDSPVSKKLFKYFISKFGNTVAPKTLLKCCAVVSCKLERPRVSILDVAPSRCFKTYTSSEVMNIFDNEFWLDLKSDFTMNSLRRYERQLREGRCLFNNDATTLFASKAQRTKERLVGGTSELLADESYDYQDNRTKFHLEGKVTLVMNLTSEAYENYKDRLFGLTFSERLLTVHHVMTQQEREAWVRKEEEAKKMHYGEHITIDDIETNVEIPNKWLNLIGYFAKEFSYLSLRTHTGCQDLIKGTLRSHAALNNRQQICWDDICFLNMIRPYLIDPFSPYEGQIVKYAAQGFSVREICRKIGKWSYNQQIQRVIKKAKLRGILDLELGHTKNRSSNPSTLWAKDHRGTRKEG